MVPHSYRTALADRLLKLSFVEAIGGMTTPEWKDFHALMQQALRAPCGPNGKTWTDGDFLDQALTNATGSILSQYAADVIRKRAIELRLSATSHPTTKE